MVELELVFNFLLALIFDYSPGLLIVACVAGLLGLLSLKMEKR